MFLACELWTWLLGMLSPERQGEASNTQPCSCLFWMEETPLVHPSRCNQMHNQVERASAGVSSPFICLSSALCKCCLLPRSRSVGSIVCCQLLGVERLGHSKLINLMCDIFCCHITSLKHHDLLWFGSVLGSRRHDLLFFRLQLQPPISARSVGWGFGPNAIHKEYSQPRIKYLFCGCNAFDCIMF